MEEKPVTGVKRNYKDTMFRMIFKEKVELLSLYNVISGNRYSNPEALEIVTLENAIYMNMKNDLAFVIDCSLNLYEHQSTCSPNMPLRNLFYIARELEMLTGDKSLYSSKPVKFPNPEFIVFYNGPDVSWDKKLMKLSDSYERQTQEPKLELLVTVLNINPGKNAELFEKCNTLWDYMQYVAKVRLYAKTMGINLAVERAVGECIQEGILRKFLQKYKSEALQMSIFEYDEKREIKLIRQDERELGIEFGLKMGIEAFVRDNLEEQISEERIIEKLGKQFQLCYEEAVSWIRACQN